MKLIEEAYLCGVSARCGRLLSRLLLRLLVFSCLAVAAALIFGVMLEDLLTYRRHRDRCDCLVTRSRVSLSASEYFMWQMSQATW